MSLSRNLARVAGAAGGLAPTGVVLPFAGSAAPSGWLLCAGQSLLRADYADLFAAIGTVYGAVDGTHFNVPDMRGRVAGGKDDMGGSAANVLNVTLTGTKASTSNGIITGLSSTSGLAVGMKAFGTGIGTNAAISSIDSASQVTLSVVSTSTGSTSIRFGVVDGATLGASGGSHTHALATPQLPSHTHTGSAASAGSHQHTGGTASGGASGGGFIQYPNPEPSYNNVSSPPSTSYPITQFAGAHSHSLTIDAAGGGNSHPNLQPTMVLNHIIKA